MAEPRPILFVDENPSGDCAAEQNPRFNAADGKMFACVYKKWVQVRLSNGKLIPLVPIAPESSFYPAYITVVALIAIVLLARFWHPKRK